MQIARYFGFIAFVYLSSLIVAELSILNFETTYHRIEFIAWILLGAFFSKAMKTKNIYDQNVVGQLKVILSISVFFSLIGFMVGFGHSGREAKLLAIASNPITYYLSFLNIGLLIASGIIIGGLKHELKSDHITLFWLFAIFFYSATTLSRSIIMYAIFLIYSFAIPIKLNIRKSLIYTLMLSIAFLFPLFQGRTDDALFATFRSLLNIFFYTGYSDYMAGYAIENQSSFRGFLWGYPGVVITNPFSTSNFSWFFESGGLYEFIDLGSSPFYGVLNANVVYPIWIGFATDSWISSTIFVVIVALLMLLALLLKLNLLYGYIFFRFFVIGLLVSPLILRDFIIELLIVSMLQILLVLKKQNNQKIPIFAIPKYRRH